MVALRHLQTALEVLELLLKVLDLAVLFGECCLCSFCGLLHVTKPILYLINLHMQIANLSLHVFISIKTDAVDKPRPGTLNCVLNVRTQ